MKNKPARVKTMGVRLSGLPVFDHDCKECTYLAHSDGWDLYLCKEPNSPLGPALVIRRSSKGHDFLSIPVSILEQNLRRRDPSGEECFDVSAPMILAYSLYRSLNS